MQAQKTFEDLITRGPGAEARAFAQKFSNKLALADDAGSLRKEMGELYSMERAIRVNAKLTTEQKTCGLSNSRSCKTNWPNSLLPLSIEPHANKPFLNTGFGFGVEYPVLERLI